MISSPSGKFYYVSEPEQRNVAGFVTQPNVQGIFRASDNKLIGTLKNRGRLRWFIKNGVQYIVSTSSNTSVRDKEAEWNEQWMRTTCIFDCETGRLFSIAVCCGTDVSEDGRFFCSHTYNGYENRVSISKFDEFSEHKPMQIVPIQTSTYVPNYSDWFDVNDSTKLVVWEHRVISSDIEKREDLLWVPAENYHFIWLYDRNKAVNGFAIVSTMRYCIRDGMALSWVTFHNKNTASNPNWINEYDSEKDESIKVEYASSVYDLNSDGEAFVQVAFQKQDVRDMPEAEFREKYSVVTLDSKETIYLCSLFLNKRL